MRFFSLFFLLENSKETNPFVTMDTETALVWTAMVFGLILFLLLMTRIIHRWLKRRIRKRKPYANFSTLNVVNKILNTLWIILGVILLSFIFIDKDKYEIVGENFRLIFYIGFVLIFSIVVASIVDHLFKNLIKKAVDHGSDPTNYKFLRYLSVVTTYIIGLILITLAFPSLRGIAQTAIGGAGVLAIVIGVASQEALANLIGGVFIIAFKPFKVGDVIRLSDSLVGVVHDITLRHTVIRNYENKMIVIPNSIINKEKVTNYDMEEKRICQWIELGISYDSDLDLAKKIMQEKCESHPDILDTRTKLDLKNDVPKVLVRVISLGDSSVNLRAWAWSKDFASGFKMKCELIESIKKRFDAEGVEIPFPHRTLVFKNDKKVNVTMD